MKLAILSVCLLLLGAAMPVDPTRPPGYNDPVLEISQKKSLDLTAIFIYPTYRLAIINSQPLKVGDKINEYTVTSISANTVELNGPENTQEVLQVAASVKKQVN